MGKKTNHECTICGARYYACDNCPEVKDFAPWRTICDTEEHYRIFSILSMVRNGVMTKSEAKKQLIKEGINKNYAQNLLTHVKDIILDIIEEQPKNKKKEEQR